MKSLSTYQAGQFVPKDDYKTFIPNPVNHAWLIDDPSVLTLSAQAHHALGRLDAFSTLLPDIERFVELIVVKEATESSRIEGTQTEVEEVYLPEEELSSIKRLDQQEVKNYVLALKAARKSLAELPISSRLLRSIHWQLMQGVRGTSKMPGEFRRSQVWIGGRTPQTASIVPPPHEELNRLLGDLENFIHSQEIQLPPLIRIAITHYQFEAIHPFLDGNGRTGRMLIMLQLLDYGLLQHPSLYLSDFIDKHRSLYYDGLSGVSFKNDLRQWLLFFLDGIKVSAEQSALALQRAIRLRDDLYQVIKKAFRSPQTAEDVLNYLFTQPVLNLEKLSSELQIPKPSANRYLNKFKELGILTELTGMQRNRIFSFQPYLRLFS